MLSTLQTLLFSLLFPTSSLNSLQIDVLDSSGFSEFTASTTELSGPSAGSPGTESLSTNQIILKFAEAARELELAWTIEDLSLFVSEERVHLKTHKYGG